MGTQRLPIGYFPHISFERKEQIRRDLLAILEHGGDAEWTAYYDKLAEDEKKLVDVVVAFAIADMMSDE